MGKFVFAFLLVSVCVWGYVRSASVPDSGSSELVYKSQPKEDYSLANFVQRRQQRQKQNESGNKVWKSAKSSISISCMENGVMPHPKNCSKFIQCYQASPGLWFYFEHSCVDNYYFDKVAKKCVPGSCPTTTTTSPATSESTTQMSSGMPTASGTIPMTTTIGTTPMTTTIGTIPMTTTIGTTPMTTTTGTMPMTTTMGTMPVTGTSGYKALGYNDGKSSQTEAPSPQMPAGSVPPESPNPSSSPDSKPVDSNYPGASSKARVTPGPQVDQTTAVALIITTMLPGSRMSPNETINEVYPLTLRNAWNNQLTKSAIPLLDRPSC